MDKAIVFIGAALTLFSGVQWGLLGVIATAVTLMAVIFLFVMWRTAYVQVGELETAVVTSPDGKTFHRFLPPGTHWLMPFSEKVTGVIPLESQSAAGTAVNVLTSGGLALNIDWQISYTLNPQRISPPSRAKLSRSLPRKAPAIVQKHMGNVLRHVIGDYSLVELCEAGQLKRLERQARQLLVERLASSGFELSRVMLGAVEMPPAVQAAQAQAHQNHLQTEYEARSLTRLHEAISQFSEADMQRLMELERIYKLGQNGTMLVYPLTTADSPTPPSRSPNNGRYRYGTAVATPHVS